MCVCVCVCVWKERASERERESERETEGERIRVTERERERERRSHDGLRRHSKYLYIYMRIYLIRLDRYFASAYFIVDLFTFSNELLDICK